MTTVAAKAKVRAALEAITRGDAAGLAELLDAHPQLLLELADE